MRAAVIVAAVLLGIALVYWREVFDLLDRWRAWRDEREFQKRHTKEGRK